MDDILKVLFYVAAVVIYALVKMRKKPAQQNKPFNQEPPKKPLPHKVPSKSFADSPPQKGVATLEQTIRNFEREIKASIEKPQIKAKPEKSMKSGKIYNEKNPFVSKNPNIEASSYSQDSKLKDHFEQYQKFNEVRNYETGFQKEIKIFEYPEESSKPNIYAEFLKEPDNIKMAIVTKEIFDRKHF